MASTTILSDNGASSGSAGLKSSGGNDGTLILQTSTVGGTATNAVYVDTSQNVGVGVVPSAWSATRKAIQFGIGGSFNGSTSTYNFADYGANFYNNGTNELYLGADYATKYRQISGQHQWYNAASGTAGNAISFTQAMTLDASGNLLLGISSGSVRFYSYNASGDNVNYFEKFGGSKFLIYNSTSDSYIGTTTSTPLRLATGDVERARIDSSGNLLVGTTGSGTARLYSVAPQGTYSARFYKNSGEDEVVSIFQHAGASGATSRTAAYFMNASGGQAGAITFNGTTTTYGTSSDYRLKENIQPMTEALAKVAALKPVTYTWKHGGHNGQGFIAHELQAIVPDAVTGEKDAVETYTDEEGNEQTRPKYQGIDTSFLVATLTAAIQEQQQLITQLQADVAALKGQA